MWRDWIRMRSSGMDGNRFHQSDWNSFMFFVQIFVFFSIFHLDSSVRISIYEIGEPFGFELINSFVAIIFTPAPAHRSGVNRKFEIENLLTYLRNMYIDCFWIVYRSCAHDWHDRRAIKNKVPLVILEQFKLIAYLYECVAAAGTNGWKLFLRANASSLWIPTLPDIPVNTRTHTRCTQHCYQSFNGITYAIVFSA